MSRRRRFFINGILLTVVGLSIRSVSLAFNSFITKAVGAEGIGLFTLIMNIYAFAITFATSGISLTVTRLTAEAQGEGRGAQCRKIMRNAVLYCLFFSVAASLVTFLFAEQFSVRFVGDDRGEIPLKILSFSLIPLSLSSAFGGYFVGVKRVGKNAFMQVLAQVFKIAVTLLCVFTFSGDSVSTVIALTLSITLTEIFCFLVLFIEYVFDRRKNKGDGVRKARFTDVTEMALPLAFSAYIRSLLITLEHTLIPRGLYKRGESVAEALASYGILHGMVVPMLLYPMAVLTSFAGLLVPEFAESMARGERGRMSRLAGEALESTLAYATAASVIIYFFAEELGFVMYDSYEAGRYISLMSFVIPIMYLDHVADSMLKGIGEHVYSMWVNIMDAALSVLLVWFLIPRMGIGGYALIIVIMEGFNFILSIGRLHKKIPFKVNFLRAFIFPLVAAIISVAISKSLFIMCGKEASALWFFLKLLFAICIFIAAYTLTKRRKTA